jgi:hypothetical protein
MSSQPVVDQCALGSDGQLLDAVQIPWYNDPDDTNPIPLATSHHARTLANIALPAEKVAGSRHSGRASRPSARMRDPDNAELLLTKPHRKRLRPRSLSPDQAPKRKKVSITSIPHNFPHLTNVLSTEPCHSQPPRQTAHPLPLMERTLTPRSRLPMWMVTPISTLVTTKPTSIPSV